MNDRAATGLETRLATLQQLEQVAPGRVPPEVLARMEGTRRRATGRVAHGLTNTVVALAGATGSGKSSLFNAIAGATLAAVGVRRPTTMVTQALVFSADGVLGTDASSLLDWLKIGDRHITADRELDGLILLDLPDHDSTVIAHRQEVERLLPIVDVFMWVVDPQKYADAALHHDYLRRFAGHAEVTMVVLNQLDTVAPQDRTATLDDLTRLLREDGLDIASIGIIKKLTGRPEGVRVFGASARTGEGVGDIRRELAARTAERRAVIARIDADLDWIAGDVTTAVGDVAPGVVDRRAMAELGEALGRAIGADAIADAVESSHERSGRSAVGWPPTRWLARLRPDPLRRLGLGRRPAGSDTSTVVDRTSLPPMSRVMAAAVSSAVRTVADRAGNGLPEPWRRRIVEAANSRRADLDDALDRNVATAELPADQPRWWRFVGTLQWLLAAVMLVGLVWLLVLGVFGWLRLPEVPTPRLGALPWPTLLAVGGALAGIVVGAVGGWMNVVGGRRRAARARATITEAALGVAGDLVVGPVNNELETLGRVQALSRALRR
jgi:hypothetical protein